MLKRYKKNNNKQWKRQFHYNNHPAVLMNNNKGKKGALKTFFLVYGVASSHRNTVRVTSTIISPLP
jgi:hypothetical protein